MTDKEQLLTTLRAEYERWQALLASLDEEQLTSRTLPAGSHTSISFSFMNCVGQRKIDTGRS